MRLQASCANAWPSRVARRALFMWGETWAGAGGVGCSQFQMEHDEQTFEHESPDAVFKQMVRKLHAR